MLHRQQSVENSLMVLGHVLESKFYLSIVSTISSYLHLSVPNLGLFHFGLSQFGISFCGKLVVMTTITITSKKEIVSRTSL